MPDTYKRDLENTAAVIERHTRENAANVKAHSEANAAAVNTAALAAATACECGRVRFGVHDGKSLCYFHLQEVKAGYVAERARSGEDS